MNEKDFIGKYVIIRTYSAGVHAGTLVSIDGKQVILKDHRRLWQWFSRLSLTDLAVEGTPDPSKCKFSVESPDLLLLSEMIEVIVCSEPGAQNLKRVVAWKN